jgi:hypothetical protein
MARVRVQHPARGSILGTLSYARHWADSSGAREGRNDRHRGDSPIAKSASEGPALPIGLHDGLRSVKSAGSNRSEVRNLGTSATRLIITDLLRLALLAHHLGTDCLFVLAARASHIETLRDRLTFMPFEFGAHAVVKSVDADSLRTASSAAFEDISALARQPIPDCLLLNGPYGRIYLDRRLSFHALTWRIRKA